MNYTWRTNWVNKYETPWGVLEKFKYANSLSNKDMYYLFAPDQQGIIRVHQSQSSKSLTTLEGFDKNKLIEVLGIDLIQYNDSLNNQIIGIFANNNGLDKNIKKYICVCPICIERGYHSLWHQTIFFDKCFIHQTSSLVDLCPKCKRRFIYEFNKDPNTFGFKCGCGYSFIHELQNNNSFFFSNWTHNRLSLNNHFRNWIKINNDYIKYNTTIYSFNLYSEDGDNSAIRSNAFGSILSSLTKNDSKESYGSIKNAVISCTHSNKKFNLVTDINYNKLLYTSYVGIYKAIARMIRHRDKFIDKNIKKLKLYKISFYHGEKLEKFFNRVKQPIKIYIPAYSYLMWRRDIEGHNGYEEVHKRITGRKAFIDMPYYYSIVGKSQLYLYFEEELRKFLSSSKNIDFYDFLCVLEHMMAYMFWEHYKNWLKQASYDLSNDYKFNMSEQIDYVMPVFLVCNTSDKKSIKQEIKINTFLGL